MTIYIPRDKKKESECQRDLSIIILPTDEVSVTDGGTFGRGAPPDVMPHHRSSPMDSCQNV